MGVFCNLYHKNTKWAKNNDGRQNKYYFVISIAKTQNVPFDNSKNIG